MATQIPVGSGSFVLLKADASQLEWMTKVFLAQDQVALRELWDLKDKPKEEDLHSQNKEAFKLPTRTIAKNFLYRMIFADAFGDRGFGGPAYAYANDPDFSHVSSSVKYWEKVVDRFFSKYTGIYQHGISSIRLASENGQIEGPSGRIWPFKPFERAGGWDWPRTNILNYPVQGTAADFMILARRIAWRSIRSLDLSQDQIVLFISTVHDDIELDISNDIELIRKVGVLLEQSFIKIPAEFEKQFGNHVNVPLSGEVKVGYCLFEDSMVGLQKYLDNPSII